MRVSLTEAVKVGQIWADNDKRHQGRHLRVESLHGPKAKCWSYYSDEAIGKIVWIRLDRFRENSNGYRLEKDGNA